MTGEDTNQLYYWRLLINSKKGKAKAVARTDSQSGKAKKEEWQRVESSRVHIYDIKVSYIE